VLDIEDAPSQEEIREAHQDALASVERWRSRTIFAAGFWLLCCAIVYPFMAGHSLHAYWMTVRYLVFLPTLVAPLALTICAICWCASVSDVKSLHRLSREDL
jgi:hypothetical protein